MEDNEEGLFDFLKVDQNEKRPRSYLPSIFITAAIPLKNTNKKFFERKYNNITMYLQATSKVPYGKNGRLLLSILTTHAVQDKKGRDVEMNYKSLTNLLDEMELPRQRAKEIKEQLECFARTTFSYERRETRRVSSSLFKEFNLDSSNFNATAVKYDTVSFMKSLAYVECDDGKKKSSIAFRIVLSNEFVELCKNHSVPIDYKTYKEISSPLGKDLYAWIVYRNNCIEEKTTAFYPRALIIKQFMPVKENANIVQERTNWQYIKNQVKDIKDKYYQNLNVWFKDDGMYMEKSPAIMEANDQRFVLITSDIK